MCNSPRTHASTNHLLELLFTCVIYLKFVRGIEQGLNEELLSCGLSCKTTTQ